MTDKRIKEKLGLRITVTNNYIKYVMKVIKLLENRIILLTGTATKINSQNRLLMTTGLPLMKYVVTLLAKSDSIRIISMNVSSWYSYSKENLWVRNNSINNLKWRNERYFEHR